MRRLSLPAVWEQLCHLSYDYSVYGQWLQSMRRNPALCHGFSYDQSERISHSGYDSRHGIGYAGQLVLGELHDAVCAVDIIVVPEFDITNCWLRDAIRTCYNIYV